MIMAEERVRHGKVIKQLLSCSDSYGKTLMHVVPTLEKGGEGWVDEFYKDLMYSIRSIHAVYSMSRFACSAIDRSKIGVISLDISHRQRLLQSPTNRKQSILAIGRSKCVVSHSIVVAPGCSTLVVVSR